MVPGSIPIRPFTMYHRIEGFLYILDLGLGQASRWRSELRSSLLIQISPSTFNEVHESHGFGCSGDQSPRVPQSLLWPPTLGTLRRYMPRGIHWVLGNFPVPPPLYSERPTRGPIMNGLIYLIGLIVVILAILSFFGLR